MTVSIVAQPRGLRSRCNGLYIRQEKLQLYKKLTRAVGQRANTDSRIY